MKKFLKVLVIIVLVVGAVAGTCYFFYSHMRDQIDASASVSEFVYGVKNKDFDAKIERVNGLANSRFDLIITTDSKMNEMTTILNYYLIHAKEKGIDEDRIVDRLDAIYSLQDSIDAIMDEYIVKCDSASFDRMTGSNELYDALSSYMVAYADLMNIINSEIVNILPYANADIKFSMIDLYINIVTNTFTNVTNNINGLRQIANSANINLVNTYLQFKNGYLDTNNSSASDYSYLNNNFIEYYSQCNETDLAADFARIVNNTTSIDNNSTNEQRVAYYFREIFGM